VARLIRSDYSDTEHFGNYFSSGIMRNRTSLRHARAARVHKRVSMSLFDLSGETAIVTGGNQRIGFAIADGLAGFEALVIIANRRGDEGRAATQRIVDGALRADTVESDVADGATFANLVSRVLVRYGHIDILVNSPAVIIRKPVEELTEEEWEPVMDVNVKRTFLCCRDVGRHMMERRSGKIINISSNVSQVIHPLRSVYAMSKTAVFHLTLELTVEWATCGSNLRGARAATDSILGTIRRTSNGRSTR